jgi:hypothetical protein
MTPTGAHAAYGVTAGSPPTMTTPRETDGVFPPGAVRLSSNWEYEPNVAGVDASGWVVQGDSLVRRYYNYNIGLDESVRIGGGWTPFTAFEVSHYEDPTPGTRIWHWLGYGLRSDGTLFRWNATGNWRLTGSAAGFASVKSMALISKTRTYDTFLANTRGGALYTIRIPITSPMKPIVTKVRTSTWQNFDVMIANKCGQYGTLLLGIDKDTDSGYLYAVGHANGLSTVIQGLGKVNGTFPNQTYHRSGSVWFLDPLNGD